MIVGFGTTITAACSVPVHGGASGFVTRIAYVPGGSPVIPPGSVPVIIVSLDTMTFANVAVLLHVARSAGSVQERISTTGAGSDGRNPVPVRVRVLSMPEQIWAPLPTGMLLFAETFVTTGGSTMRSLPAMLLALPFALTTLN